MPAYTIETTYDLPIFRHATYIADTPDAACKAALADDNWESMQEDYDSSGEIHVTGIWEGDNAAYSGTPVPLPSQYNETIQRRSHHFEILLGLLKMLLHDVQAAQSTAPDWLTRSAWAIARGEAILAGSPDPDEPVGMPGPSHILALLREERVRDAIAAVLEVDHDFGGTTSGSITDDEVRSACRSVVATIDLSDTVSNAEFLAAMEAIRLARRPLKPSS